MLDIEKYKISQQELNDYQASIVIPKYKIEIKQINDFFDLCIILENGDEISQGFYAYENIDTSDTGKQFEEKYVESLCEENFHDKKLSVIAERKKKQATIGDLEVIDDKMDEVMLACEYETCLLELAI